MVVLKEVTKKYLIIAYDIAELIDKDNELKKQALLFVKRSI